MDYNKYDGASDVFSSQETGPEATGDGLNMRASSFSLPRTNPLLATDDFFSSQPSEVNNTPLRGHFNPQEHAREPLSDGATRLNVTTTMDVTSRKNTFSNSFGDQNSDALERVVKKRRLDVAQEVARNIGLGEEHTARLSDLSQRDMFEVLLELIGRDMRRTEQDGVDKVQMETETKAFAGVVNARLKALVCYPSLLSYKVLLNGTVEKMVRKNPGYWKLSKAFLDNTDKWPTVKTKISNALQTARNHIKATLEKSLTTRLCIEGVVQLCLPTDAHALTAMSGRFALLREYLVAFSAKFEEGKTSFEVKRTVDGKEITKAYQKATHFWDFVDDSLADLRDERKDDEDDNAHADRVDRILKSILVADRRQYTAPAKTALTFELVDWQKSLYAAIASSQ